MLQFEKFYNRNQLVKHTGLSRASIEKVVNDMECLQIGNQKNYKGIDILIRLNPNNQELQKIKDNLFSKKIRVNKE